MSQLDKAREIATPQAQVTGLWLGLHLEIPSISPQQGELLSRISQATAQHLFNEHDRTVRREVFAFLAALDLVIQVEMVHQAVVIDQLAKLAETPDAQAR